MGALFRSTGVRFALGRRAICFITFRQATALRVTRTPEHRFRLSAKALRDLPAACLSPRRPLAALRGA